VAHSAIADKPCRRRRVKSSGRRRPPRCRRKQVAWEVSAPLDRPRKRPLPRVRATRSKGDGFCSTESVFASACRAAYCGSVGGTIAADGTRSLLRSDGCTGRSTVQPGTWCRRSTRSSKPTAIHRSTASSARSARCRRSSARYSKRPFHARTKRRRKGDGRLALVRRRVVARLPAPAVGLDCHRRRARGRRSG
jgi:hypothetical protein